MPHDVLHLDPERAVTKENLATLEVGEWRRYRKVSLTSAIRVAGPFRVETSETENEPFYCEDGWLAIDARGYPYAIADDEFQRIYEPAGSKQPS